MKQLDQSKYLAEEGDLAAHYLVEVQGKKVRVAATPALMVWKVVKTDEPIDTCSKARQIADHIRIAVEDHHDATIAAHRNGMLEKRMADILSAFTRTTVLSIHTRPNERPTLTAWRPSPEENRELFHDALAPWWELRPDAEAAFDPRLFFKAIRFFPDKAHVHFRALTDPIVFAPKPLSDAKLPDMGAILIPMRI